MRSLAPKADRGTNNGAAARVEARKVLRSCGMGVMYQESFGRGGGPAGVDSVDWLPFEVGYYQATDHSSSNDKYIICPERSINSATGSLFFLPSSQALSSSSVLVRVPLIS